MAGGPLLPKAYYDRTAILALALGETLVWAGFYYSFPALLLQWQASEGWPKTELTAAFTGAVVTSALVSPWFGRLVDRGLGPWLMTGAALTGAAALALLPLAPSLLAFAGLWLIVGGAMGGCLYEPCFALITRTRGSGARKAITAVTLLAGFASTLSFPLNHWIAEAYGWETAVRTFAAIVALLGAPMIWFGGSRLELERARRSDRTAGAASPEPAAARKGTPRSAPVDRRVRSSAFWCLALGFTLLGANHGVIINHLLPLLSERGIAPDIAVLAASMIGPMQVAGRIAIMAGEGRVSSAAVTTTSFVAVAVATLCLMGVAIAPLLLVPFVVLQGGGYGVVSIMRPVMTREVLGEERFGAISGAVALPYLIGYALSPFVGSLLWEIGGYGLALAVVWGSVLLGLVLFRLSLGQKPLSEQPSVPVVGHERQGLEKTVR